MKALTVQQPWAWGLIYGPKRIENRTWDTRYRGPLLIHAGKSKSRLGDDEGAFDLPSQLDFGAIIGIVDLVDCVPFDAVRDEPFAEGPWCWVTANPQIIRPIACKGALGLWSPSPQLLSLLPELATVCQPI